MREAARLVPGLAAGAGAISAAILGEAAMTLAGSLYGGDRLSGGQTGSPTEPLGRRELFGVRRYLCSSSRNCWFSKRKRDHPTLYETRLYPGYMKKGSVL